ncbi:hypothetical protein [Streptomyces chrestomyceticus]|uniref:hypothetical protein n=1 Tax=Streptomyces chrestomyceticus TaxID=68185 RepID=UPI0033EF2374
MLGDKGYDSNAHRDALRNRQILPVISHKRSPNIKGIGKLRNVVEQTFALLHQFKRLAVRGERDRLSQRPKPPHPRERTPDLTGGSGGFGWPMIRQLSRHITIASGPGSGKTIRVRLPR